ncbi:MAG: RNA methyltransferase [Lachnospiraceae bacterium]|nr:RNA methyltransferase [Lachnospiraceae bacterium]
MITSISNKKVKQIVQWQNKAKERRKDGIFLAEGFKMLEEAPESLIREIYLSEDVIDKISQNQVLLNKIQRFGYETVTGEVFAKISDTQTPQGVLTVLDRPQYKLGELLKQPMPLFVVLENLQDPGNLGTIVRTGEGAGITAVIMTQMTVDLFNPKTIRSTMGSIYRVPYVYVGSLEETLEQFRQAGIRTYAAHLKGKTYYDSFSFREPTAFLIGNEGNGLTKEAADMADTYLKIPMEGQVESLNAAVATSLLIYEAHRQRSLSVNNLHNI